MLWKLVTKFAFISLLIILLFVILLPIILPRETAKCRQVEALTYVGSMNRAQQDYFLEKNKFTESLSDLSDLGLRIASQTMNYTYSISKDANGVFNYGKLRFGAEPTCESKCSLGIPYFFSKPGFNCPPQYLVCFNQRQVCSVSSYAGAVYLKKSNSSDFSTYSILCKSKDKEISQPIWQNGEYICGQNSEQIK
jgi:competence protein ComGC